MAIKYVVKQGDTLNDIAKGYGYKNYKDAGISSVPSGNFDLIRPGEEINIGNYDPTKASTINTGAPVISSNDRKGEYDKLSGEINDRATDTTDLKGKSGTDTTTGKKGKEGKTIETPADETTGDPIYDAYLKQRKTTEAKEQKWAEDQKREINQLLPQTLSMIDDEYRASKFSIESTYAKLIDTQVRLNALDRDRIKAYGLQNGGQYMPIEFTRAVSASEQKGAGEIGRLEGERTGLLSKAKSARREGRIGAMRQNVKDLQDVEDQMRKRVDSLLKEVQTRFEITEKAREKKEKERQELLTKSVKTVAFKYLDDFNDAKDPTKQDELIKKIIKDSNGTLSDEDYYDIYSSLATASQDSEKSALDMEKKKIDIENTKNTIYNRNRSTDATIKKTEKDTEKDNVVANINEYFSLNNDDGNPIVGEDGFANPVEFKKVMTEAQNDGMSREDFLAEFAHLINENNDPKDYGLTQAERDKYIGK